MENQGKRMLDISNRGSIKKARAFFLNLGLIEQIERADYEKGIKAKYRLTEEFYVICGLERPVTKDARAEAFLRELRSSTYQKGESKAGIKRDFRIGRSLGIPDDTLKTEINGKMDRRPANLPKGKKDRTIIEWCHSRKLPKKVS